jgi:hypothetical protein
VITAPEIYRLALPLMTRILLTKSSSSPGRFFHRWIAAVRETQRRVGEDARAVYVTLER